MTIVSSPDLHHPSKFLVKTSSTKDQEETESECRPYFVDLSRLPASQLEHLREKGLLDQAGGSGLDICLLIQRHVEYLEQTWTRKLRSSFVSLDASRPWMLYWTMHACDLLHQSPSDEHCQYIVNTLQACWAPVVAAAGGFGGGPGQMPHAATTYAAVMALCILATSNNNDSRNSNNSDNEADHATRALEFLREIREPLLAWMLSLREPQPDGSVAVRMQHDGEIDVRATYCIMAVAKLLNVARPELTDGLADYIVSCQTYEGGFGGEPWSEAHGGYAFCATAALFLLGELKKQPQKQHDNNYNKPSVDLPALMQWLASRQMAFEGGFNGRSNKLVDGCYSFWQGGAVAIVSAAIATNPPVDASSDPWLLSLSTGEENEESTPFLPPLMMDEGMLQRYILLCAQDLSGGLRDKPRKRRDFYHSCYNLSGLSVSQHYGRLGYGHATQSKVEQTHPCYNIRIDRVQSILRYFGTTITATR